jgi:very-short-patch-repair endonuclease
VTRLYLPLGTQTVVTPLAELIEKQGRAISTRQFNELGVSDKRLRRLSDEGWIHHKHRGVWIVGGDRLTPFGAIWAGYLAVGGTVSHRSAAVIDGLRASYWKAELTVPRFKPDRDQIKLHTSRLPPELIADHDGLPVTTTERTLLDLADVLTPRRLEIAINQAEIQEKLDHHRLKSLLLNANGRRGIRPLRDALDAYALGQTLTESQLEEEFLALTRKYGFPQPATRKTILGFRTDFVWPDRRIIIETDGARFHRELRNREEDALRDRIHRRTGWTVDRVTYRQVFFRPEEVVLILEGSGVPRAPSRPRPRRARRRRPAASPRLTA